MLFESYVGVKYEANTKQFAAVKAAYFTCIISNKTWGPLDCDTFMFQLIEQTAYTRFESMIHIR